MMSKVARVSAVLLVVAVVFACSSPGSAWLKEARGYHRTMVSPNCVPLARTLIDVGIGFSGPLYNYRVLYAEDGAVWLKDSETLVEFSYGKKEVSGPVLWTPEHWPVTTEDEKIIRNMKVKLSYELRPSDVCRLVESGVAVEDLDELLLNAVRFQFHPAELAHFVQLGDVKKLSVYARCAAPKAYFDERFKKEVGPVQALRVDLVEPYW